MNDIDPAGRQVASQRVADIVAERILTGALPPGTRIIQDELADELDASRIPVREALRILASRGLVTLRANVGAWVSEMTIEDLSLSYEIRERIEPLLLTESMRHLTPSDLLRMQVLQDEIDANTDVDEFLRLDREFHWTSYGRHRAPQLAEMVARLWDSTQQYRRAYVLLAHKDGSWIISAEHRLLLAALRAGDPDTASMVLTLHIRRTRLALNEHPELVANADRAAPTSGEPPPNAPISPSTGS